MRFFDELGTDDSKAGTFELSTNFEPIPSGTQVLAYAEDAAIDQHPDFQPEEAVKIKWHIVKPAEYEGRVIFQKVKINDPNRDKRLRQLRMLAAIDANAGGAIAKHSGSLSDNLLQKALTQKPMLLRLEVWEFNGKTGNWVSSVAPKPTGEVVAMPAPKPAQNPLNEIPDDSIPF